MLTKEGSSLELQNLPKEILKLIASMLDDASYNNLYLLSKAWKKIYYDIENFYRRSYTRKFVPPFQHSNYPSKKYKIAAWQKQYMHDEKHQKKILKRSTTSSVNRLYLYKNFLAAIHDNGITDIYDVVKNKHVSINKMLFKPIKQKSGFIDVDIITENNNTHILTVSLTGEGFENTLDKNFSCIKSKTFQLPGPILKGKYYKDGFLLVGENGVTYNTGASTIHFSRDSFCNDILATDQLFVIANRRKLVEIWDAKYLKLIQLFEGHKSGVYTCKWFNNNLVSCDFSGVIKYWDIQTGKSIQTFSFDNPYNDQSISALTTFESNLIISGGYEVINFWDIRKKNNPTKTLESRYGLVLDLHLFKDCIFSGHEKCTAKRWDLKTNRVRDVFYEQDSGCRSVEVNRDRNELYVGWANGVVSSFRI